MDVAALEKKYPPSVEQTFFYPDSFELDDPPEKRKRIILLPIFHVNWGDRTKPGVMVSIFGPTKELLGIRQNDQSFSSRPNNLLKDTDALLAIPDEEFLKYSDAQLKDLIKRFAAVTYDFDITTNAPSMDAVVGPRPWPGGTPPPNSRSPVLPSLRD